MLEQKNLLRNIVKLGHSFPNGLVSGSASRNLGGTADKKLDR